MRAWFSVGIVGTIVLLTGWWLSMSWPAPIAAGAGLLGLLGVLARRAWSVPRYVVAFAVVAQVAVPRRPDWALVIVVTVLLAVFLAVSEIDEDRLDSASWSAAIAPHLEPIGCCLVAAVLSAAVYQSPPAAVSAALAVGIGAAACAALLFVVHGRTDQSEEADRDGLQRVDRNSSR